MQLLVATHNVGKIHEYQEMLPDLHFVGLSEIGLGSLEVEETEDTFVANAALKATAYARASGSITLSDDSGLCVDALNGEPGVYSARYGGQGLDDAGRRMHLLKNMQHVAEGDRTAQFVCVIAIHDPRDGKTYAVEGVCEGRILFADSDGNYGHGYDKLFVPNGYEIAFADMPSEMKNRVSHRGIALLKAKNLLAQLMA